eukprot:2460308-Rhodomonas_salina.1
MGCYAVLKEYQNYYCQQGVVKEFVTSLSSDPPHHLFLRLAVINALHTLSLILPKVDADNASA